MKHYRKNTDLQPSTGQALRRYRETGFSLIEVLVTIVILMIGLLGLAGLQSRALTAQMESYQRSQALVILKGMADRIDANRANAAAYITATPRGTGFNGSAVMNCASLTGSDLDLCEWHNELLGAAETQGTNKVGAMIGARGCVYQIAAPASGIPSEYVIAVTWQGFNSSVAPVILCGKDQYSNETLRRVVALPISLADL